MNSDLISKTKLIEDLKLLRYFVAGLRSCKSILAQTMTNYQESVTETINKQPTAYDVDKVLHEYRELIKEYEDDGYSFHISSKVEDIIRGGGLNVES